MDTLNHDVTNIIFKQISAFDKLRLYTQTCWLGDCPDCSAVRSALKREYKEQVRRVIDKRIVDLYLASSGPFKQVNHRRFNGEYFEDETCRIVRIHVEQ